jgi:hypothetical protein
MPDAENREQNGLVSALANMRFATSAVLGRSALLRVGLK